MTDRDGKIYRVDDLQRSRAATFAGGWAVAFDLPTLRSAFGIAGAGVSASPRHSDRRVLPMTDGLATLSAREGRIQSAKRAVPTHGSRQP